MNSEQKYTTESQRTQRLHRENLKQRLYFIAVMAFVATTQPEKARAFYCEVLGLSFAEDSPFALVVGATDDTDRNPDLIRVICGSL